MSYQVAKSSWVLVICQFLAVAICCWPVGWQNNGWIVGLFFCAIGTSWGLYALYFNPSGGFFPEPKPNATLITSGPYRYMRHPMYSALLVMMFGIVIYNGHLINGLGLAALAGILALKIPKEERLLRARYPDYDNYVRSTAALVPWLFRAKG